jgi:hypothetical protein
MGHNALLMQSATPGGILWMNVSRGNGLSAGVGGELKTARTHTTAFIIDNFLVRVHSGAIGYDQVRLLIG